ncbi:helix-turn-helix domain-containing protein [Bacillus spongiae]|uniref:Helix-turn-helix domain-containing protein n=1 Tax=Bacillus spongiae TaxID=2683610 RepID=A0ABU8HFN0_9BACI
MTRVTIMMTRVILKKLKVGVDAHMPSDTFFKLKEMKQQKIYDAAIKEFCRVPYEEVSIKNIVTTASIARGSFYQYFADKEDLFIYITHTIRGDMQIVKSSQMDFFEFFISLAKEELMKINAHQDDLSDKAKVLHNIAKSPIAIMIFDREMEKEVKNNSVFKKLVEKSYGTVFSKSEMNALMDLISQTMRSTILPVITKTKTVEEAMKDLTIKLNFIKKGVENIN